jgi:hypothetical protein
VRALSDKLKIPILIFQPCNNLAGYTCVAAASPLQDEEHCTRFKIICLSKIDNYFDMLVVIDSKEMEFHNRLIQLLQHFTPFQMKVLVISFMIFIF